MTDSTVLDPLEFFRTLVPKLIHVGWYTSTLISLKTAELPPDNISAGIKVNRLNDLTNYRNQLLIGVCPSQLDQVDCSNLIVLDIKSDIILKTPWITCSNEIRNRIVGMYNFDNFYPMIFGYTIINSESIFTRGLRHNIFRGLLMSPSNTNECLAIAPVVLIYNGHINFETFKHARYLKLMPSIKVSEYSKLFESTDLYQIPWETTYNLVQLEILVDFEHTPLDKIKERCPNLKTIGYSGECTDPNPELIYVNVTNPSWDYVEYGVDTTLQSKPKNQQIHKWHRPWCGYQDMGLITNSQKSQIHDANIETRRRNRNDKKIGYAGNKSDRRPRDTIRHVNSEFR